MSNRLIFRVENAQGIGMYRIAGGTIWSMNRDDGDCYCTGAHHPSPFSDPSLGWSAMGDYVEQERWFFGFGSLAQLEEWLCSAKGRDTMAEQGLVIQVYVVPEADFRQGEKQAIFRRDSEVLLGTLDLVSFRAIEPVRRYA